MSCGITLMLGFALGSLAAPLIWVALLYVALGIAWNRSGGSRWP